MIIKKIILAIIGLFFCLSQVFADDLDLNGIWIRLGFTCQLPDGHFKMLGAKLLLYHALVFKEDNQVEEIFGVAGCEVVTTGTYSVSGARLNISLEDSVRKLRPSSSCIIPPSVGKKFISYDEVLLKNDSLYLRVFSPGNFLIQQCPNGVVFEQLMQSKRRLQK